MSDSTPRDDDTLGGGFDQTNDMVGGLEGESGGTAEGERHSKAEEDEGGGAGCLLDDLHAGRTDPYVGDNDRVGSTAAGEDRGTEDPGA